MATRENNDSNITFAEYEKRCRTFIKDNSPNLRGMGVEQKRDTITRLINQFMFSSDGEVSVEGFKNEDGTKDVQRLREELLDSITRYGILTEAMNNPDVFEIRCNGREIKVEVKGRCRDLIDAKGNILMFNSIEEQEIVIRKLLGEETRLTPKAPIANGSTIEGYRIAATHKSAMGVDPQNPDGERFHSFVLRKFKTTKMGLGDIVKFGTMSDNMARILSVAVKGGTTFVTVGPTASGKTTTNNGILQDVPHDTRTVLLQNPSEIDLRVKDVVHGYITNDVLHLEAKQVENPTPQDATMENLMAHILRLSPTFVCFGELRTNKEFKLGLQIAQAGHPINCTYHAESSKGAIKRFLTAYLSESGNEPADLALETLTDLIHLVIVQKIMRDGTRKVLQISEIVGVDPNNPNVPLINDLYVFQRTGDAIYDDKGQCECIPGHHKRVGKLTDKIIKKLEIEGINKSQYDFLLKDVDENEEETYTGENISNYGMAI